MAKGGGRPTKGSFPKADAGTRQAFEALVPEDPRVKVRPMFGNISAFVNGNMFMGVFGPDLFVRLPEQEQSQVKEQGGSAFEPVPGRPMKGYVALPPSWRNDPKLAEDWVDRSLTYAGALPPKKK